MKSTSSVIMLDLEELEVVTAILDFCVYLLRGPWKSTCFLP